ncbi:MAG: glycosyltransferase [Bacteroidales bacterium]|nr:glycosyltransferase [Bacteroidales bacterium]
MESIISQDYPDLEIIVVDGGSTDGTQEVIGHFADQIDYWVSEPDLGIFDAMNKGLARATGEWVNFMNAGDVFSNNHVLSTVFNKESMDAAVIYGDSIAHYPAFKTWRKALPPEDLWKGMICCHQSMFFLTNLIRKVGYNADLHFSADYEMILRLYIAGKKFRYIPEIIAVFDTRGISNAKMVKSARSNLEILSSTRRLTKKEKRFHKRFILQSKLTEWFYQFMPSTGISKFLKWFYRNQIIHE